MRHLAIVPLVLRSLVVSLVLLAAASARSQALPSDLDCIPRQAAGFIHVRAAELYRSDACADLRNLIDKAGPKTLQTFARKCPLDPASLDRVTLVFLTPRTLGEPFPGVDPEAVSALVIVRTSQPFDRLRIIEALGIREKLYRRHLYHFNEDLWSGLLLLDERTFLIGAEDSIVEYFDQLRASEASGPLQAALRTAAAGQHHVVVGVNPPLLAKEVPFVPQELRGLFAARCGAATLSVGKELRLELRLDYEQDNDAADGEKAARAALELARGGLAFPIAELEKLLNKDADKVDASAIPENFAYVVGLGYLREIDGLLAKTPIERQARAVRVSLVYNRPEAASLSMVSLGAISFLGVSTSATFRTVGQAIGEANENPYEKHLKTLHQALEKYHADKGRYPPPALLDTDGRPILSWRVALLPYLGDEAKTLHAQFRLDEPWDSLHNKRLIKKMPPAYLPINNYSWRRQWRTGDVLFVGPGAAFSPKQGRQKADLPPAAILLAHADQLPKGIYWSKPADLAYAPGQPLPRLFEEDRFGGQYNITLLLANGTFRTINNHTPEQELRQLIEGKK